MKSLGVRNETKTAIFYKVMLAKQLSVKRKQLFQESRSWENFREVLSADVRSPQNSKKKTTKNQTQTIKEISSTSRVIRENQYKIQSCSAITMVLIKQHYICSLILILSYKQNLSCGLLDTAWDRTTVIFLSPTFFKTPQICGTDKTIFHHPPQIIKRLKLPSLSSSSLQELLCNQSCCKQPKRLRTNLSHTTLSAPSGHQGCCRALTRHLYRDLSTLTSPRTQLTPVG